MASDETESTTTHFSTPEHESDDVDDPNHHQHHLLPHGGQSLSRLSVCSSSFTCGNEDDNDDEKDDNFYGGIGMSLTRLSIENFDADAEFSADSDSDNDPDCYSLPATPPRRRRPRVAVGKDYASENEAKKGVFRSRKNVRRRVVRKREEDLSGNSNSWIGGSNNSGESDGCGGIGGGMLVITRPKGGRRSLCMDLEEVKACRDLGFELEHERMLEIPQRLSASGHSSSGGNSPIANWRISSPG